MLIQSRTPSWSSLWGWTTRSFETNMISKPELNWGVRKDDEINKVILSILALFKSPPFIVDSGRLLRHNGWSVLLTQDRHSPSWESVQNSEADQAQEWFPRLRTARHVKGLAWIELTGILVIEPLLSGSSWAFNRLTYNFWSTLTELKAGFIASGYKLLWLGTIPDNALV